jgi:bifunctional DNase/RNase
VTGVDIDDLGAEITAATIHLTGPAGTSRLPARLADGLAIALAASAPVQVTGTIMDRLAVPAIPDDGAGPGRAGDARPGTAPAAV